MSRFIFLFSLFLYSPAYALDPPEDFGIKLVPTFMAEKVVADCEYLDEVSSRSAWGGLVAGSLGKKGVMKRMYKKANKLGATHMVLVDSAETDRSGFTAGSAHAFRCGNSDIGYSAEEATQFKQAQQQAENSASNSETPALRAIKAEAADSCKFLKSIMKGAGGSGDPSQYLEFALEKALRDAQSVGADSYTVVNMDTTDSGASIVIEALKCS